MAPHGRGCASIVNAMRVSTLFRDVMTVSHLQYVGNVLNAAKTSSGQIVVVIMQACVNSVTVQNVKIIHVQWMNTLNQTARTHKRACLVLNRSAEWVSTWPGVETGSQALACRARKTVDARWVTRYLDVI